MSQRPPIPSELKRRILVEAGHRCAIPTCRQPTTEIAHIIPWNKVKKHEYVNLIALCPNCHTRADKGEIDRKSLRIYKRILQRLTDNFDRFDGVRKVPDFHRLQLDSVAFYSPSDVVLGEYIEWKTLNPENLYKMLKLPYLPAVFVPTSTSILSSSELYYNTTRWYGDMKNGAIVEFENKIHDAGILYEYWTVTANRPRTITEPHTYRTGLGATKLQESITELVSKLRYVNFGWVIISGGITVYILGGAVSEKSASITVTTIVSFIPNNFPFVYIDEVARAVEEPLPMRVMKQPLTEEWRSSVPCPLFLDEPPEEELTKRPPASLIGYLGPKPEPRSPDMPIRTRGLVALSVDSNRRSDLEGIVSEMDPILCKFSTLPMRFNDLEEIRIVGHKATAFLFPYYDFHDFHLILFDIDCDVNQHKALKLREHI